MKPNFQNTAAGIPAAQPTRKLLEETRLSRLPSLSKRGAASCAGCQTKLTTDNQPLPQAKVCRKCLAVYSVIDLALNESAEAKTHDAKLAKMQRK